MKTICVLVLVVLGVYIPIDTWYSHNEGMATPLQYISLGIAIYFWLNVTAFLATPKDQRKMYSQNDLNACLLALQAEFAKQTENGANLNAKKKEGSLH